MEDILTLRIVLAITAASALIGGFFGALLFIFNEYTWKQFKKAKLAISRERSNRLPPTTN
jgi:hypothetical protein